MRINKLEITSAANVRIKAVKKLEQKRERDQQGLFVIEGFHLVEEAILHGAKIETILYAESADKAQLDNIELSLITGDSEGVIGQSQALDMILVTDSILTTLSHTPAPQGIIAVIHQPAQSIESLLINLPNSLLRRALPHLLLLDNVQDPGNVGTMIRTAEAAGFKGVVLGDGCADLYNDKTIRATQGALFQLPIIKANLAHLLPELHAVGYESWVTTLEEATFYPELAKPEKCALIMGNEGQGVNPKLQNLATTKVKIPMLGQSESLNVGIAAGILMYDLMPK